MKVRKKVRIVLISVVLWYQGALAQLPNELDLSTLNHQNGIGINGENTGDNSGISVSSAGDFNNDGIDDLIIGAYRASSRNGDETGKSYLVFVNRRYLPNSLDLSTLDGENGIIFIGGNAGDESGRSVSSAGDVNGDGVDDLIIGASGADTYVKSNVGKSYVIFGSETSLQNPFDLSTLDGKNGFIIIGESENDYSRLFCQLSRRC